MPYKKEIAICKKKVRFANQASASAALQRINPAKRSNRPIRVYKCPVCSGWHLTSQRSRHVANPFTGIMFYIVLLALIVLYFLIS